MALSRRSFLKALGIAVAAPALLQVERALPLVQRASLEMGLRGWRDLRVLEKYPGRLGDPLNQDISIGIVGTWTATGVQYGSYIVLGDVYMDDRRDRVEEVAARLRREMAELRQHLLREAA